MITWLASYPRSGNTFLRILLHRAFNIKTCSLHNDRNDIGASDDIRDLVGHEFLPEDFDINEARKSEKDWFIKTHGEPVDSRDRTIYLVRDGRECSVSFARYLEGFIDNQKTIRDVVYGNTIAGTWGGHLDAWQPRVRPGTLLIRFEELVDDPGKFVEQLAQFLGIDAAGTQMPDFSELQAINPKFFSSGSKDSWKTLLPEKFQLAFWLINGRQMLEYGYDTDAPAVFDGHDEPILSQVLADFMAFNFHRARHRDQRMKKLSGIVDRLGVALNAAGRRLDKKEKQLERKTAQFEKDLGQSRQRLQQTLDILTKEQADNSRLQTELKRELQQTRQRITSMEHSSAWRLGRFLTLPLRHVKDRLRPRQHKKGPE